MKIKEIEEKVEKARKELKQKGTKPEIIGYMIGIYRENLYDEFWNEYVKDCRYDEYEEEETK